MLPEFMPFPGITQVYALSHCCLGLCPFRVFSRFGPYSSVSGFVPFQGINWVCAGLLVLSVCTLVLLIAGLGTGDAASVEAGADAPKSDLDALDDIFSATSKRAVTSSNVSATYPLSDMY